MRWKPTATSLAAWDSMAEREGFEPSKPCGLHTFQACALDQLCDLSEFTNYSTTTSQRRSAKKYSQELQRKHHAQAFEKDLEELLEVQ